MWNKTKMYLYFILVKTNIQVELWFVYLVSKHNFGLFILNQSTKSKFFARKRVKYKRNILSRSNEELYVYLINGTRFVEKIR